MENGEQSVMIYGVPIDVNVAWRQLGFAAALSALRVAMFGQGSGKIWLDNLQHRSSSVFLPTYWSRFTQLHSDDAGVVCSNICK